MMTDGNEEVVKIFIEEDAFINQMILSIISVLVDVTGDTDIPSKVQEKTEKIVESYKNDPIFDSGSHSRLQARLSLFRQQLKELP